MAEFGVVMHDWSRMCKHFWSGDPTDDCSENCPLMHVWCPMVDKPMMNVDDVDAERLEATVTKWAAEHPEPVYPRWIDWLADVGLIINTADHYAFNFTAAVDHIPADIAEKLGIEPKEG